MNELGEMKKDGVSIAGMMAGGGGGGSTYHLPPATSSTLGGIKVGSGLSVTEDGTLSSTGGGGGGSFDYSTTEFDTGQKWIDGKKIYGIVQNAPKYDTNETMCRFEDGVVDTFIGGFGLFKDVAGEFTHTSIRMKFDHRSGSYQYAYAFFSDNPGMSPAFSIICTFYTKL